MRATLSGVAAFGRFVDGQRRRAASATDSAVKETARAVQAAVRADVGRVFARGGKRLAGAVRLKDYPDRGRGPASLIYSKFGRRNAGGYKDFIAARLFGADIRPKSGEWLAIPFAPRGMTSGRRQTATTRKRGAALAAEGRLDFVPIKGGRMALLVHRRKSYERIYFLLVKRIRFPGITSPAAYLARALARMPEAFARAWGRMAFSGR